MGVYLTTRTTKEQAEAQQAAALRLERKEIILDYLKETQDMQAFIRSIWYRRESLAEDKELSREASIRSHQMWFCQRKVHVVASKPLREACLAFTEKLDSCLGFSDDLEKRCRKGPISGCLSMPSRIDSLIRPGTSSDSQKFCASPDSS